MQGESIMATGRVSSKKKAMAKKRAKKRKKILLFVFEIIVLALLLVVLYAVFKTDKIQKIKINEDDILLYTARVHFNSLKENNATDKINKSLREENKIDFILNFTKS